ncbi:sodium/potassium-transporting ATPase subunit beta-1-interacting protein 3 [Parasteatoda tepidariorum]|uniref:sodium/potassium-transporting ATPase subunit beta-1-interacting protein 3 n=1 Tax=Parasteatoda tepidariorum TaxID=114398 RepID=UPI001C720D7B|nr:sodium/potassium-transporting ATPase subunit beta-1-interacting protein-like isoform X1 [Parasteatoda tepidariorum]
MACCAVRCILITTCVIQLVSTIQRQILDFLGYMWTPILVNFFQIIFAILGIFGAYQYKIKYITCYAVWTSLWLGWNVFVICVYFEAGILTRDTEVLNMGTGSRSWWLVNGAGCRPIYNTSHEDPFYFPTPSSVEGCVIEYFYIEAIQAAVQCFLAILGIISASFTIYVFTRDDDSCSVKQIRNLPYSIEYHNDTSAPDINSSNCQRPMTPRKVKQRSTRSKRGSRRRYYQNPVTKLINASNNQNNYNADYYPAHVNTAFSMSQPPSEAGSRPTSALYLNGRPSPIYMNETDTVI